MKVEKKARQLALKLVGGEQNPEPLIEVLVEMANWQKKRMMKDAIEARVIDCDKDLPALAYYHIDALLALRKINASDGDKVKLIIIKED